MGSRANIAAGLHLPSELLNKGELQPPDLLIPVIFTPS